MREIIKFSSSADENNKLRETNISKPETGRLVLLYKSNGAIPEIGLWRDQYDSFVSVIDLNKPLESNKHQYWRYTQDAVGMNPKW